MLDYENIDVETNVDFFVNKEQYLKDFPKIVFTGMIDEFFDYKLGELEYRSLRFENETLDMENYQGNAVVNYTDAETPYTRIIEHKHFEFGSQAKTIITKEHSKTWEKVMSLIIQLIMIVIIICINRIKNLLMSKGMLSLVAA